MSAGFAPKQVRPSKSRGDAHTGFGSGGFGEDTKRGEEGQNRLVLMWCYSVHDPPGFWELHQSEQYNLGIYWGSPEPGHWGVTRDSPTAQR